MFSFIFFIVIFLVDGCYVGKCEFFCVIISEYGLICYWVYVEVSWLE